MSPICFVDLVAQQRMIGVDVEAAMLATLRRTDWVLGREVQDFEEEFASYCGAQGAVGTDCGLSALELALRATGVGPGDEVIIPGNTFIATALAVSSAGAEPVLVDVDPRTHLIDPRRVEEAVTPATRAVVPVHLYGQTVDMDAINGLARRHGLVVIEDACQAHGAWYGDRRAGSLGDAAAFSFYPSKNLGAYGDGGIVVSSDPSVIDAVRSLRNYGQQEKYNHVTRGMNRRLDTIQAAALRVKLRHLDDWNAARGAAAVRYRQSLQQAGVTPPHVADGNEHVWHLHVVQVEHRAAVQAVMESEQIEVGVHYPIPIHRQPAYRTLAGEVDRLPIVEGQADHLLSLPMHPFLQDAEIDRVVEVLAAAVRRSGRARATVG